MHSARLAARLNAHTDISEEKSFCLDGVQKEILTNKLTKSLMRLE